MRSIERSFVLDRERSRVPVRQERPENRSEVEIADAELAELSAVEALEVHVFDERLQYSQRVHAADAGALEVDRIEIHADVRPIDEPEDLTADVRTQ